MHKVRCPSREGRTKDKMGIMDWEQMKLRAVYEKMHRGKTKDRTITGREETH